ncbi:DUF2252 domain-containing protein [Gordonia alkaliphila]|uniref:DUF2252 domain-containing protein n=1 Tax=Gordonia alkaliphila TaxID=1053547 RepID=A0ABP8Z071_9ACTN
MTFTAEQLGAGPAQGRRDPIAILVDQEKNRLTDLIPVRHQRMATTPFTFYRGAAALMAADLGSVPDSGIRTQLCGDAHLSNFGLFLSPERQMVFDLNDFDEAHPGPFEWDVKRLAASMVVAAQANGADDRAARRAARWAARAYRRTMVKSADKSVLDCWYARVDADEVLAEIGDRLDTAATAKARKVLKKSRHRNSEQALTKLCELRDGTLRIKYDPPLLIPAEEAFEGTPEEQIRTMFLDRFEVYRKGLAPHLGALLDQYTFVEAARKVVGVGSVGTRCWVLLFVGKKNQDPLFLQLKEAQQSVLAPYVEPVAFANEGHRVVIGQQLLQASSDILLGWLSTPVFQSDERGVASSTAGDSDFYIRQLRDGKGSVVVEDMPDDRLAMYGELCGKVLAQAHARSGARGEIAAYVDGLGRSFDRAIADWSLRYSAINEADHDAWVTAIADGTLSGATLGS